MIVLILQKKSELCQGKELVQGHTDISKRTDRSPNPTLLVIGRAVFLCVMGKTVIRIRARLSLSVCRQAL